MGLETLYDLVTFRLPWVSKGFCRMLTSGCRTKTSSACGLSGRSWPCAGLRRVRWNAPNALECAECAGMRRLRRLRRIAPYAPIARCLRRIAPIALELRWNSAYSLAHSHKPMAGAAWWRPPYLQPAVSGQCLSRQVFVAHYSTSSRSPAIFLQLSVMQRDKQCRSKTKCVVIVSHSASFFGERPRISPQLTCS